MTTCCGPPKKCCHVKYSEPTKPDECRCGLGANNGIAQVLIAQLFLFVGLWLSVATIADCGLVILEEPIRVQLNSSAVSDSIGMLSFRDMETDRCFYWWQEYTIENLLQIEVNMDLGFVSDKVTDTKTIEGGGEQLAYHLLVVLGHDWFVPMGFFAAATGLALFFVVYSVSYCCSTQVKACRIFAGVIVVFFLPLFQGLGTLLVFQSEWCDIQGCSLGRTTICSIVAAVFFFLSGIFFFIMENWPGQKELDKIDEDRKGWETDEPDKGTKGRQSRDRATSSDDGIPHEIGHHTRSTDKRSAHNSSRRSNSRDSGRAFRDDSGRGSAEITKVMGGGSDSSDNDLELMESAPADEPSLSDREPRPSSSRNSPRARPKTHDRVPRRKSAERRGSAERRTSDLYSDEFTTNIRKSVNKPPSGGDVPGESMASTSAKPTSRVRNSIKKIEKNSRQSKKSQNNDSDKNKSDGDDEIKEPSGMVIEAPDSTRISVESNID